MVKGKRALAQIDIIALRKFMRFDYKNVHMSALRTDFFFILISITYFCNIGICFIEVQSITMFLF